MKDRIAATKRGRRDSPETRARKRAARAAYLARCSADELIVPLASLFGSTVVATAPDAAGLAARWVFWPGGLDPMSLDQDEV